MCDYLSGFQCAVCWHSWVTDHCYGLLAWGFMESPGEEGQEQARDTGGKEGPAPGAGCKPGDHSTQHHAQNRTNQARYREPANNSGTLIIRKRVAHHRISSRHVSSFANAGEHACGKECEKATSQPGERSR